MKLNPRTGHDYYAGKVERAVQEALARHLRPGMVFYDLGANVGFYSLIAARLVGPEGKVFAFDPEWANLERLKENVARNGFSNIVPVRAAVFSNTGSIAFLPSDPRLSPDRGTGRIARPADTEGCTSVSSIALDEFVTEHPSPDFIKCDVEGAEAEVLKSAEKLFQAAKPTLICEVHDPTTANAVSNWLKQRSYSLEWFADDRTYPRHLLARPRL